MGSFCVDYVEPASDQGNGLCDDSARIHPDAITVAGGLPGLRFEASSTGSEAIHLRGTWLFDGTTAYTVNCQFGPSGADEVGQACDLVLKSFKVSK